MFGIIFLLLSIYVGILATAVLKGLTLLERGLLGIVTGFLMAMWATFLFFLGTNLSYAFWISFILFALLSIILTWKLGVSWKDVDKYLAVVSHSLKKNFLVLVFFVVLGVFFASLYSSYVLEIRPDGWYAGINSWGDNSWHLSLINHFRYGAGTLEYPIFPGERLTYPFLIDFFTAVLAGPGLLEIRLALVGMTVFLSLITSLLIYAVVLRLGGRKLAGCLAVLLFLFGGGLGFVYFFEDVMDSHTFVVSKDYANLPDNKIYLFNTINSYLIPQRAFLIGLPVGITILLLLLIYINKDVANRRPTWLVYAGILAGTLPVVHTHSYLVVGIVAAVLALLFFSWSWLYFFIPAGILSLPQVLWIMSRVSEGFIHVKLGWMSDASGILDFGLFWILNAGVLFPLAIAGLFLVKGANRKFLFTFWVIFIISNIVVFQPEVLANIKLLLFWWIGVALSSGIVLAYIASKGIFGKVIFAFLFFFSILSGALVMYHAYTEHFQMFSKEDIELGNWLIKNTSPNSIFLTHDNHNHPVVAFAGRRILMGFPGWLWSHGINYHERQKDIKDMRDGGPDAKSLLDKYKVDYALIGPSERAAGFNETYFKETSNQVYETEIYRVFKIQ